MTLSRRPRPRADALMLALENRIVFDGAALATAAEALPQQGREDAAPVADAGAGIAETPPPPNVDSPVPESGLAQIVQAQDSDANAAGAFPAQDSGPEPIPPAPPVSALVFVDARVGDQAGLLQGLSPDARVVVLDPNRDGLSQIGAALSGYSGLEAIHIVSHGADGVIDLGSGAVDAGVLANRMHEVAAWGDALKVHGDILIYGCDLAQTERGRAFADTLAHLAGADVAASTDDTGAARLGGDWDLEYRTGAIEAASPFAAEALNAYDALLANPVNTVPGAQTLSTDTVLTFAGNLKVSDDDGDSLTVTLSATNGALTLNGTTGLSFAAGDGTADASMSFSGAIADINAALNGLTYKPDVNYSGADTLSVSSSDGATVDTDKVAITVTNANAPVLTLPSTSLATQEDTASYLPFSTFSLTDADPGDVQTLTLSVAHGTLTVVDNVASGVGIVGSGMATATLTGTAAQISATLQHEQGIQYKPDADYNSLAGAETLSVAVNDGQHSVSASLALDVTPVNDLPSLKPAELTVAEKSGGTFSAGNFNLTDIDNLSQQVIYKIETLPAHGVLKLNGNPLVIGSTFDSTQAGNLSYTHDGTQVRASLNPGSEADSFAISVDDGAQGVISSVAIPIVLTPVNQAPTASGGATLYEGQTNVPIALSISDPDQAPGVSHTVTIDSVPAHGTLFYQGNPVAAGDMIVDLSGLTYSHDGNDGGNGGYPPNESFTLSVTDDGGGAGIPLTAGPLTINLTIQRDNDDPTLVNNAGLTVAAPENPIDPAKLLVSDPDSPAQNLAYTVVSAGNLAHGELQRNVSGVWIALTDGSSFTQDDIDQNRLRYVLTDNAPPDAFTDFFTFTVKDGGIALLQTTFTQTRDGGIYDTNAQGSPLTVFTFNINKLDTSGPIAPGTPGTVTTPNDPPTLPTLGQIGYAQLSEGDTATITTAQLQAADTDNSPTELVYRLLSLPAGGVLKLDGTTTLGQYDSFTQADIDASKLTFEHGGGETFDTGFKFNLTDGKNVIDNGGANYFFRIQAKPVNDAPSATSGSPFLLEDGYFVFNSNSPGPQLSVSARSNISIADVDGSGQQVFAGGAQNATNDPNWDASEFSRPDTASQLYLKIDALPSHGWIEFGQGAGFVKIGDGSGGTLDRTTLNISQAELDAGKFRYVHDGNDGPGELSDSFAFKPYDRFDQAGVPVTVPLAIAPLNDPPVAQDNVELTVYEGGTGTIKGSNGVAGEPRLTFTDSDNNAVQRQYRISDAVDYGTLYLSGKALGAGSVFTQDDLDNGRVTYTHNGSETVGNHIDSFSFTVSDGGGDNPVTLAKNNVPGIYYINVNGANDSPTLTVPAATFIVAGATQTFTGANAISVDDIDLASVSPAAGEVDFLQVTVDAQQGGATYANGAVTLGAGSGVTVVQGTDGVSGKLVFQGTKAQVNAALAGLSYTVSADVDGQIDLVVTLDDRLRDNGGALTAGANGGLLNQGGLALSDALNAVSKTVILKMSKDNDAPTVSAPATQTFAEDSSSNSITGIVIGDADDFGQTMQVTLSIPSGTGSLALTASGAATVGGSSIARTIIGTKADINSTLANLKYTPASNYNNDQPGAGPINLTVLVDDKGNTGAGGAQTATQTIPLTVTAVNDPPSVTAPGGQTVVSNAVFSSANKNAISVNDAADLGQTGATDYFQLALTVTQGTLTLAGTTGLDFAFAADANGTGAGDGTGDATMTFRGTKADIDAALNGLTYTPNKANANQSDSLAIVLNDLGNTGSGGAKTASKSVPLFNTEINEAPTIGALDAVSASAYTENGAAVVIDANATLSDPELSAFNSGNGNWNGAKLAVQRNGGANAEDALGVTGSGSSGVNFSGANIRINTTTVGAFTNAGGALSITFNASATNARVNQVLDAITYLNASDNPPSSVDLSVSIDDQNSNITGGGAAGTGQDQGGGGKLTDTKTIQVKIDAINDAPTLTASPGALSFTESEASKAIDGGLILADVDDANMSGATVKISADFVAGDALTFADQNGIAGSYDASAGILTLTGAASKAEYQAALRSVGFFNPSDDPTVDATKTGRTISFAVTDVSGSATAKSADVTRAIAVIPAQDAPALGGAGNARNFVENAGAVTLEPNLTLADADDTQMNGATVKITSGFTSGDVLTATTAGTGIAASYDGPTGVLTLSGKDSIANYLAALDSVAYDFGGGGNPTATSASRTVTWQITDANSDLAGAALSNLQTTTIDVTAINRAPSGTDNTVSTLEDAPYTIKIADFGFGDANLNPADDFSQVKIASLPGAGVLSLNGTPVTAGDFIDAADIAGNKLTFAPTPNANGNGYASFTFQAKDDGGTANGGTDLDPTPNTLTIDVAPVNDAPSFVKGQSQSVGVNAGAQSVPNWATGLSKGPADESGQALNFLVENDKNGLFSVQPFIDANGNLTYTPAPGQTGTATVTVYLRDDGGTANGGIDKSAAQTFTITVAPPAPPPSSGNHAPSGADKAVTMLEDATYVVQSADFGFADPFDAPANQFSQVQIDALPTAGALTLDGVPVKAGDFVGVADIDAGRLRFAPAPNESGEDYARFAFRVKDDGGALNGGTDTDPSPNLFSFKVLPVNDAPSFVKGADQSVGIDAGLQSVPGWATGLSKGPADESGQALNFLVENDKNGLFSVQPFIDANGKLTYTPAPGQTGVATVTVLLHDDGGTANGGVDTSVPQTFVISVGVAGHAPAGADKTAATLEDAAYVIRSADFGFSDPLDATPNRFVQVKIASLPAAGTLTLNGAPVQAGDFVGVADIDAGRLRFAPAPNESGEDYARFAFQAMDDGTGANLDPTPNTLTFDVLPVNDAPSFAGGGDQTVQKDAGPQTVPGWAKSLSKGPADESGQALAFVATNDNNGLFSVQPFVDANGDLRFTSAPGQTGTATVTVYLHDDGGTANGGIDVSAPRTFVIAIAATGQGPVALPVRSSGLEDPSAPIPVDLSASSPGSAVAGFVLSGLPANGRLYLDPFETQPVAPGTAVPASGGGLRLYFRPDRDWNGLDGFGYAAMDDKGKASASANAEILVLPVNDAPSFFGGGNQSVAVDAGPQTVPGWATNLAKGPADEAGQSLDFVATNDNNGLFSVQPYIDADGTLHYTPAPGQSGSARVTARLHDDGGTANGGIDISAPQTFVITVAAPGHPPQGADKSVTFLEDSAYTIRPGDFGFADPEDAPGDHFVQVRIDTVPSAGVLSLNGVPVAAGASISIADIEAGGLRFAPAPDGNGDGYARFAFQVMDDGAGANLDPTPNLFTFDMLPVNDAPAFKGGGDVRAQDAGPQTVPGWATNIAKGPANESGQTLDFVATNDNNGLFSVQPFIGADGTLHYTPAPGHAGMATVTVYLHDNGGTANGGVDASPPRTFKITIDAFDHPPAGADKTVTTPETRPYVFAPGDFGFSDPQDVPANAFVQVKIDSLPASGVLALGGAPIHAGDFIDVRDIQDGKLVYAPAPGGGLVDFAFQVQDDGAANLDPVPNVLTIDVLPVNKPPAFAPGGNVTAGEDAGPVVIEGWAKDLNKGAPNESGQSLNFLVENDNPGLFAAQPAIDPAGNLRFTPAPDQNGTATVTVRLRDDGGTANGGSDTSPPVTFVIVANPVADPPAGADKTLDVKGGRPYALTAQDFGFSDPQDTPANRFVQVEIVATPTAGKLVLDGAPVTPGQVIDVADIEAGKLSFVPRAGGGVADLSFRVKDDGVGDNADPSPNVIVFEATPAPMPNPPPADVPVVPGSLIILTNPQLPNFPATPGGGSPAGGLPGGGSAPFDRIGTGIPPILASSQEGVRTIPGLFGNIWDYELNLVGEAPDRLMTEEVHGSFAVPPSIFRHTNPAEILSYEATRPDGSPLPGWLKFNVRDLTFSGTPPRGARSVDVLIVARDAYGHKASATFHIFVNREPGRLRAALPAADAVADAVSPEWAAPVVAREAAAENAPADAPSPPPQAHAGGLSAQLRAQGKHALLRESRALLQSARS
jgi:hypothetical protein